MGNRDSRIVHVQKVEGEEVDVLLERWLRGELEVLLFELASLGVLVTEDEVDLGSQSCSQVNVCPRTHVLSDTYLGTRTCQVRTEHDCPRCLVRELLARCLESILKELHVSTTTVTALLVLNLVLYDEGLVAEVNSVFERCRDSMVCCLGLRD